MSYKTEVVAARTCPQCGAKPGLPCIGKRGARKAFHIERVRGVAAVKPTVRIQATIPIPFTPGEDAITLFERGLELQNASRRRFFHEVLEQCESPIEELLMAGVVTHLRTHPTIRLLPDVGGVRAASGDGFVWFTPQASIGPYRADFLMVDCREKMRRTVIECDGHDFHERTKEQAQRDRARDRWFTSCGYTVLRFTGSEIYRNPMAVADEIAEYLERCG